MVPDTNETPSICFIDWGLSKTTEVKILSGDADK